MPFAQLTSKVQHTMVRLASLVVLLLCSCVTSATWPALPRFATQSPKSGNQIDEDASANEDLKLLVNVLQEEKALLGRVANNERARVHHLKKELTKLKADHEQEQLRSQEVFESEMDAIFSQYEADKVLQEKQIIEQLTSKHNAEIEGITQKLSAEKAEALKAIHNEIDRLKAENALLQLSNSELKNELSSSISHMSKLAMASAEENDRFSQEIASLKAELRTSSTPTHSPVDHVVHSEQQSGSAAVDGTHSVEHAAGSSPSASTRQHRSSRRRSAAASPHTPE